MDLEQRIVCAAIRNKRTGLVICGPRHFDHTMHNTIHAIEPQSTDWIDAEQGFVDQYGSFIDRKSAWKIAAFHGQLKSEHASKTLYSEDLY